MNATTTLPYPFRESTESGPFEIYVTRMFPYPEVGYKERTDLFGIVAATKGKARHYVEKLEEQGRIEAANGVIGGRFVTAEYQVAVARPFTGLMLETYLRNEEERVVAANALSVRQEYLVGELRGNKVAQGFAELSATV